jgi:hypothetical protein
MRKTGLSLALVASIASAQMTLFTLPAFADDAARPAPPTGQTTAAPTGMVDVHIKSDAPVTLSHRASATGAWETACSSPCDTSVPVGDEYQVSGDGLNASKTFRLDASKGKVTLDVSVGKKSSQSIGTGLLIGAAVVGVVGIVFIAISKPSSAFPADGTTSTAHTNEIFTGGALLLGGAIAAIYGGAMIVNNGSSAVNGDVAKPPPAYGANDIPSKVAQNPVPNVPTFIAPVFHFNF